MKNIINNAKQKIFLVCLLAIFAVSAASVRAD
jgi:hypothetical protein